MNRRLSHNRPTVALTGGDDRPTPACLGKPEPYDTLTDHISGPEFDVALASARGMCGTCDLMAACLKAHEDEQWAKAVLGRDLHRPTKQRPECGTATGYRRHMGNNERPCAACAASPRRTRKPAADCGTESGYTRHVRTLKEAACPACRKAKADAEAARVARKDVAA